MNLCEGVPVDTTSYKAEPTLLTQNTSYAFRVCTECELGMSNWTESEQIMTSKTISGPPGKPYDICIQNHSIEIQWSKPLDDSYVQKYKVSCFEAKTSQPVLHSTTTAKNTQAEITGLMINTTYCFSVQAICENNNFSDFSEYTQQSQFLSSQSNQKPERHQVIPY